MSISRNECLFPVFSRSSSNRKPSLPVDLYSSEHSGLFPVAINIVHVQCDTEKGLSISFWERRVQASARVQCVSFFPSLLRRPRLSHHETADPLASGRVAMNWCEDSYFVPLHVLVGGLRPINAASPQSIPAILLFKSSSPTRGRVVELFPGACFRVLFPSALSPSLTFLLPIGCWVQLLLLGGRFFSPTPTQIVIPPRHYCNTLTGGPTYPSLACCCSSSSPFIRCCNPDPSEPRGI